MNVKIIGGEYDQQIVETYTLGAVRYFRDDLLECNVRLDLHEWQDISEFICPNCKTQWGDKLEMMTCPCLDQQKTGKIAQYIILCRKDKIVRYDDELFSKVMGFPCDNAIDCNMDEENVEYYIDEYNECYPRIISKKDLIEKCSEIDITLAELKTNSIV